MNSNLYSFIDIFANNTGVIIPKIQRDYAQGRKSEAIVKIRDDFLNSLYNAVTDKPIVLDFVYGDIKNGVMTPLDGQQRLTTLFLLHWYAARRAGISDVECEFLHNFGYETRYSAREFCKKLVDFKPSFENKLSAEIIDQVFFPLEWEKDPTVSSMLVMLDAIDEKFKDVDTLWDKLKNRAITFYFLPIKDMGLTDELYIRLNSRGKPLTDFENFKAKLKQCISAADKELSDRIMRKFDLDWTDMLWKYRVVKYDKDDRESQNQWIIDDGFLKYFHFICDIICYENGDSTQGKNFDEIDLLKEYFTIDKVHNKDTVIKNVKTLEDYFDCWLKLSWYSIYRSPEEFLNSIMSNIKDSPFAGKILVDNKEIDIFKAALYSYSDKSGKNRVFPLNRMLLLYAVTTYLLHINEVREVDFRRRLREVNNLIQNSSDEISDRRDKNSIPAILGQIRETILFGVLNNDVTGFNTNQMAEEIEKQEILLAHPEQTAPIFTLEDHPRLNGQISVVGVDNAHLADRFVSLFTCNLDLVDCAMMTIGNYYQKDGNSNNWRYQFASKKNDSAWQALFHKSSNSGFENTSKILVKLLSKTNVFTNDFLKGLIDDFISYCESSNTYPFRYYYVKYDSFRPGSYGKYSNNDAVKEPYMFSALMTRLNWSSNTYMPYLKEADNSHISREDMGQSLVYDHKYIVAENDAFRLKGENDNDIDVLTIKQNAEGIDIEDRIIALKNFIAGHNLR